MNKNQVNYIRENLNSLVDTTDLNLELTIHLLSQGFITESDQSLLNYAELWKGKEGKNLKFYEIALTKEDGYERLCSCLEAVCQFGPLEILKRIEIPAKDEGLMDDASNVDLQDFSVQQFMEQMQRENDNVMEILRGKMGLGETFSTAPKTSSSTSQSQPNLNMADSSSLTVGKDPCSFHKVIKIIQRSNTSCQLGSNSNSNWTFIARELDIPQSEINRLADDLRLNKKNVIDVMSDILYLWGAAKGSEAKLEGLINAFTYAGLREIAENLGANFLQT